MEALEFYTEQTRKEKSGYGSKATTNDDKEKKLSNPKASRSTPAPRHIREPPPRPPVNTLTEEPSLPAVDLNLVKGMDKDVQLMMEKLKIQQVGNNYKNYYSSYKNLFIKD